MTIIPEATAFMLQTTGTTPHGWVVTTSIVMDDDSLEATALARAENLLSLHRSLRQSPPTINGIVSSWHAPEPQMMVAVKEIIIKQDLITGSVLEERELDGYDIPYAFMG